MRGVNLSVFTFDYDLTWMAFFLTAEEKVIGRFGGRDAGSPDTYLTLGGLKHAMRAALANHAKAKDEKARDVPVRTPETYPSAKRFKADACIHCHQVFDFQRDELRAKGKWSRNEVWKMLPPLPENAGFTLDPQQGDKIRAVTKDSPAAKLGLQPGDELRTVQQRRVASFADVQMALHELPMAAETPVAWLRGGKEWTGTLKLPEGWRKTDIAWRPFMWNLEPVPGVYGKDLTAEEKQKLGLGPKRLAFRQGQFVPEPSRRAGVQASDIILGIDGKPLEMTMLEFNAFIRLNYKVGDKVTLNVIRNGKRMDLPLTLANPPR